jgi:hypothetical protein
MISHKYAKVCVRARLHVSQFIFLNLRGQLALKSMVDDRKKEQDASIVKLSEPEELLFPFLLAVTDQAV